MDPYKSRAVFFDFKNSHFSQSLKKTHYNVKDKRIILFMKHVYLKKIVNWFQISIILASTIITFCESMKPHIFKVDPERQSQMISICFSTYIAISTAIYKFIKIDDRKEEIYKILQMFNDIESIINCKIKQVIMIHYQFEDEMQFFNKNKIISKKKRVKLPQVDEEEEYKSDHDENDDTHSEMSSSCFIDTRKQIMQKYYRLFEDILNAYERDEIDKKIYEAKKQFRAIFSYNEIIYYKGKIVESMLLEKVHVSNRNMLEAPIEDYKNHYRLIKLYQKQKKEKGKTPEEKNELDENIERLKQYSNQLYNDDEILYHSTWINNLCLYFSSMCNFCLIMNLYLNLAIKRSKFQSLKKKLDNEGNENTENMEFLCCRFRAFDAFMKKIGCSGVCCCSREHNKEIQEIYYCCDC
tara:strand:+ start:544 stop:1773 length:1230 start_codon:yes stop_codon:yes gene_type:complete